MAKVRITIEVDETDIVDNGDGTLIISGATRVVVSDNPIFELKEDFENVDFKGIPIYLKAGSKVKLMMCNPDEGKDGQGIYQYDDRNFWMPNDNGVLYSGNVGINAMT